VHRESNIRLAWVAAGLTDESIGEGVSSEAGMGRPASSGPNCGAAQGVCRRRAGLGGAAPRGPRTGRPGERDMSGRGGRPALVITLERTLSQGCEPASTDLFVGLAQRVRSMLTDRASREHGSCRTASLKDNCQAPRPSLSTTFPKCLPRPTSSYASSQPATARKRSGQRGSMLFNVARAAPESTEAGIPSFAQSQAP
jgi:hypothetical protein